MYNGPELAKKLNDIIREQELDIRIVYKSKKLKQLVEEERTKSRTEESEKMEKRNVVYQITCKKCEEQPSYIGETGRTLAERMKEHYSGNRKGNNITEPARHALEVHKYNSEDNWRLEILHVNQQETLRKINEAKQIIARKPQLKKRGDSLLSKSKQGYQPRNWTNFPQFPLKFPYILRKTNSKI